MYENVFKLSSLTQKLNIMIEQDKNEIASFLKDWLKIGDRRVVEERHNISRTITKRILQGRITVDDEPVLFSMVKLAKSNKKNIDKLKQEMYGNDFGTRPTGQAPDNEGSQH